MTSSNSSKKRRKSNIHEPPRTTQQNPTNSNSQHEIFTQWSKDRGVQIHHVQPTRLPGRGIGLVTTGKIQKDERILLVPEKAMFHATASRLGTATFQHLRRTASLHAQLALSLAAELRDARSPLHAWKATWPVPEDLLPGLPLTWRGEVRALLPASTGEVLERQRGEYARDAAVAEELRRADPSLGVSEDVFRYYWAIVGSRSFHFKPAGAKPWYMVLCPFIDYMNHGPSGTGVIVQQTAQGYSVTADRDYNAGEEILATYGAHSNDKLLVHYGFVHAHAPGEPSDDDIRLDHLLLPHFTQPQRDALRDAGFLGGYALLPGTNEVCFKTQVAVRAKVLTTEEWEYFMANGEDLRGDRDDAVRRFLIEEVMRPYVDTATAKLRALEQLEVDLEKKNTKYAEVQVALDVLKKRWNQIRDAVTAYVTTETQAAI